MNNSPSRRRRLLAALALLVIGAVPVLAATESGPKRAAPSAAMEDPDGARVIVRYKAASGLVTIQSASASGRRMGPLQAATLSQRLGITLRDGHLLDTRTQVVHGDKSISSAALAARLAADPDVEFAVPDLRRRISAAVPNDPLFGTNTNAFPAVNSGQWYLQAPDASPNSATSLVSPINAQVAWNLTTGLSSIVVADIDTGVRYDHPDLVNKLLPGYNMVSTSANSGVGTGQGWTADASDPGDYTTRFNQCNDNQPAQSSSWHGTQVMGLIGAQTGNGLGMASIGHDVMLLPVRALGTCGGYDSDIISAMLWAAGIALPQNDPNVPNPGGVPNNPHPAQVINLSLGSGCNVGQVCDSCPASYSTYIAQIVAAGVTVIAAAGNDEGLAVNVPANCPGVIAVAAVRNVGTKVGFSDIGPEVAMSAPGGNCINDNPPCLYTMLSTTNPGTTTPVASASATSAQLYTDSSNYAVGTSFATPLVSGTAALMLSVNPTLKPTEIASILKATARTFPTQSLGATSPVAQCHAPNGQVQDECICTTSTCGAGMLDAGAAVTAAATSAAPVASIQASATSVLNGSPVSFDGSASTAPSGLAIASYQWTITSGATLATFTSATNTATATVATSAVGSFTVQLTVTDSAGGTASASSTVQVTSAVPTATIVASASSVTAGTSVSLDGSGSKAPNSRSIAAYQWSITSGSTIAAFSGSSTSSTATLSTSGAGIVTVQLTVTDSAGATASASSTISVQAATASGGSSGGGAMSAAWLAALGLAVAGLIRRRPPDGPQSGLPGP